jgi:hypothetical protein
MIINLLALLVILTTGAVAGALFTVRYAEHRYAELRADEDQAYAGDLLAIWSTIRDDSPSQHEPSVLDPRDRLPI